MTVAFQALVMLWPLGQVHATVHPEMAALPAWTVTSAPKPPDHSLVLR